MTFDQDQFERVIAYYRDCVVQDAGRSIRLQLSDQGRKFIPLMLESEWTSSEKGELSAKLTGENAPFASELRQRRASAEIMYGYPILVDHQHAHIAPVFLQHVDYDLIGDKLTVRLVHDWPEVNDDFARSIGVTDREERTKLHVELGIAEEAELPSEGLTYFASRLAELRRWNEVEPLDPERIPTVTRLGDIKSQGLANRHILVITDRPSFTRGLETELRRLSEEQNRDRVGNTALSYFFGSIPRRDTSKEDHSETAYQITEIVPLNEEQRSAVKSAFRDDLTVVTGPPGTGKSQIVTTVIANAWMRQQSVLFASHNHKAVDVVEERVNDLASKPLMIRTGRRARDRELRNEISSYLANVLASNVTEQDRQDLDDARAGVRRLEHDRDEIWVKLEQLRHRRNRIDRIDREITSFRSALDDLERERDVGLLKLERDLSDIEKRKDAAKRAREQEKTSLDAEIESIQGDIETLNRERDVAKRKRDVEIDAVNHELSAMRVYRDDLHRIRSGGEITNEYFDNGFKEIVKLNDELESLKRKREIETQLRNSNMAPLGQQIDRLGLEFDPRMWERQNRHNVSAYRSVIRDALKIAKAQDIRAGSIWGLILRQFTRPRHFRRVSGLVRTWFNAYDLLGTPPGGSLTAPTLHIWIDYLTDALAKLSEWEHLSERNKGLKSQIEELESSRDEIAAEFDDLGFDQRIANQQKVIHERVTLHIESIDDRIERHRQMVRDLNDAFDGLLYEERITELHRSIQRLRDDHETKHDARIVELEESRQARILAFDDMAFAKRLSEVNTELTSRSSEFNQAVESLSNGSTVNGLAEELREVEKLVWDAGKHLIGASVRVMPDRIDTGRRRSIGDFRALFERLQNDQLGGGAYAELMAEMEALFPKVMAMLPSWCVTNLSARGNIPLHDELFDLVVIDEASQCDIPSALPLLYRAKRALIIGDPNQLRHITSINGRRDQILQEKHGLHAAADATLAFSQNSLFDAAERNASPRQLNEHFRSHADIIGFSNQHWYNDRLLVCTDYNDLHIPTGQEPGIRWHNVNGRVERSSTLNGNINRREAEELSKQVIDLIADRGFRGSVGIVTPFRAQANLIRSIINQRLEPSDVQRCDLITDTAHAFQGDEKDVVFFSPCVEFQMPSGAEWFIGETGNLFNVAITRARSLLVVVGNLEACLASRITHVKGFAEFCDKTLKGRDAPADSSDFVNGPTVGHWERPFYEALQAAGLKPMHQYAEGQYRLDFAFVAENTKLDIEVDGELYHREWDGSRSRNDLMRDHRLIGMGWKVKRFWVYQLRDDMDQCVAEVKELLL